MVAGEENLDLFFARAEQGIRALDDKYGRLCRRLSCSIVGSEQDAEECVNDAYLGAWNAIPPARPSPLLPYIAKIVRNVSLNAYWKKAAAKRNSRYTVALEELETCFRCFAVFGENMARLTERRSQTKGASE